MTLVPLSLTWPQVRAWRAQRQHLHKRAPREAIFDVIAQLGGLHAQVMSSAELTLWARVENLEPEFLRHALWKERTLVKIWAMRGTLHLFPSSEYGLWQAGLSTYGHFFKPAWLRYFGLTLDELIQITAAVGQALKGQVLTREQLAAEVTRLTGSATLGGKLL